MKSSAKFFRQLANSRGFTLIELMATLGVAGLLMVIAIPAFRNTLPRLRLNDAARQVATEFQQVRMKAIAKSIPQRINFATATTYTVESCPAGACVAVGGNMTLPAGITITPPGTAEQFQTRGNVPAAMTILLTNGTNNKWVCVTVIGRIKIQDTVCP
jgi:prepilin-type N-terminal cleavage/methylation domain-containing protein